MNKQVQKKKGKQYLKNRNVIDKQDAKMNSLRDEKLGLVQDSLSPGACREQIAAQAVSAQSPGFPSGPLSVGHSLFSDFGSVHGTAALLFS